MKTILAFLALGSVLSAADSKAALATGEPNTTVRKVSYHDEIIKIPTEVKYTTVIKLDPKEVILDITCGDKDFWTMKGNGANIAYIKPSAPGLKTNFNLITATGIYSLLAREVSGDPNGHADLVVEIEQPDQGIFGGPPKYISAAAVEPYRQAAEAAQKQAHEAIAAATEMVKKQKADAEAAQAMIPAGLRHDYEWDHDTKASRLFGVKGIWSQAGHVYIEATPREAPVVYSVTDGKESPIEFTFANGVYQIPTVIDEGRLKIGKSVLNFHRVKDSDNGAN